MANPKTFEILKQGSMLGTIGGLIRTHGTSVSGPQQGGLDRALPELEITRQSARAERRCATQRRAARGHVRDRAAKQDENRFLSRLPRYRARPAEAVHLDQTASRIAVVCAHSGQTSGCMAGVSHWRLVLKKPEGRADRERLPRDLEPPAPEGYGSAHPG
jgi:hypothetical protein